MKKLLVLIAVISLTGKTLRAQSDYSSESLNPQFKLANILQNFNKPLNTHNRAIRSDDRSGTLIPLYDSIVYWKWNYNTKRWDYNNKDIDIVYNPKNLVAANVTKDLGMDEWENESRMSVTYNSCNLVSNEITQSWNGTDWVNCTRTINTYNPCNLEVNSLAQIWSGTDWLNCFQQIPSYNSDNLETNNLIQNWDYNAWVNSTQTSFTYNSFNDMTGSLYQLWNDNEWVNFSQTINTYDRYDNLSNSVAQIWSGSDWLGNFQSTGFIYNPENEIVGFETQVWNGNSWSKKGYVSNSYDANNLIESYASKNVDDNGTITSGDSVTYYFNKTVNAGTETNNNSTLRLYPNPSSNIIYVVITLKQAAAMQMRLINVQGQTVWSANAGNTANYQGNISVANLPAGVYLFELVTGNNTQSQKVVVTK